MCILPWHAGGPGVFQPRSHPFDVIRMVHVRPAPALHLVERSTGVVVPALVEPEPRSGWIGHPRELRDVVRKRLKQRLTLAHGVFGGSSFGDVHAHTAQGDRPLATIADQ